MAIVTNSLTRFLLLPTLFFIVSSVVSVIFVAVGAFEKSPYCYGLCIVELLFGSGSSMMLLHLDGTPYQRVVANTEGYRNNQAINCQYRCDAANATLIDYEHATKWTSPWLNAAAVVGGAAGLSLVLIIVLAALPLVRIKTATVVRGEQLPLNAGHGGTTMTF